MATSEPDGVLTVRVPKPLEAMFVTPRTALRWRVMNGGRGSGKSFTAAKMAAIWGAESKIRILCTREFQNSIKQSFHAELKNAIASEPWLTGQYDVGADYIRHKTNGTEFIFAGLRRNIDSIKSLAQIDICIVEEAESVPAESWLALVPTIRAPGSGFLVIYNPKRRDSWVAQQFDGEELPPRCAVVTVNYNDNPWFPPELEEQRQHDQRVLDHALYKHIWLGDYWEKSEAQVFSSRWRVDEFSPRDDWSGPYYGVDFGFANDETAGVKLWINNGVLYIEHEIYERHIETDALGMRLINALPGIEKHVSRADNARPETISYLRRHGLPRIEACRKGKGSIEDGVAFIKSHSEVVIHPRCNGTAKEFELYSYKVDRLSGEVQPVIVDAYNHAIDAIRYALEPLMRRDAYSWKGFG